MILEALVDSLLDLLKMLPILFLTYLLMEWLEHRNRSRHSSLMSRAGWLGPLIGSAVGIFPQCGFSAAGANLYAGGLISVGTMLSIFFATSDEMLPILISELVSPETILSIIGLKFVIAVASGYAVDIGNRILRNRRIQKKDIHDLCEQDHCHCEAGSVLLSALLHTLQIAAFIFVITFLVDLGIDAIGQASLAEFLGSKPVVGVLLTALFGLIPSCGPSVVITQLYLSGLMGLGQMMAGLLVNAGVGLLVLFRSNRHWKENMKVVGTLYVIGIFWGLVLQISGLTL